MPRKSRKKLLLDTQKPPLLFLEPPLDGARHHIVVPQVRGALNPKSFVTDAERQNNTAFTSWVRPQFDQVQLRAAPARRGRRLQASSIQDRSSQLSRKTSVCKYPSLSFEKNTASQSIQQKNACATRAAESTVVARRVQQASHPDQRAAPDNETPKRRPSLRKRTAEGTMSSSLSAGKSEGAATSSSCFEHLRTPASHTAATHNKIPGCSTSTPDTTNTFILPDVETPDLNPSIFTHPLLTPSQTSTPPRQTPDILAVDTPERDYGVKVTWRRRKGLMKLLVDRGQLSSAEVQIIV